MTGDFTTTDPLEVREAAVKFEAVKMAVKQDKAGWVITLRLKSEEAEAAQNRQLILDWVGSRYMLVMVRIADNEEAVIPKGKLYGDRLVTSAAMMCDDHVFQQYMVDKGLTFDTTLDLCAEALRVYLGIKSRAELKDNEAAQAAFVRLRSDFYGNDNTPLEGPQEEPHEDP